jgi:hypothetical protein
VDYLKAPQKELKNQQINLPKIVGDLIIINSSNIINQVRQRWLMGESALGGFIGEYSSSQMGQDYKAYKMSINSKAGGHVDLTLTGDLGAGITVKKQSSESFLVYSTDSKYEEIGSKYGFDEFGLTDLEWAEMQSEMLEIVLDHVLNKTYALL